MIEVSGVAGDDGWATGEVIPPPDLPRPLTVTAPQTLNTEDLSWESFELLVRAVALRVDGAVSATGYGVRGQSQHGLDVVAWLPDGTILGYQAKRYSSYTVGQLKTAVRKFAKGPRPHSPSIFYMVLACNDENTKLQNAFAELKREFPD
ncbi:restriction endonuclease (plasmid) [Embleya sp. NBC_00888]|uniref:hypothetical protein n=1 Tax=Embleya sp. NBC_00888 TaxID=2975960 RepID=UPI00386A0DAC|nr:restriction endonuclease [Embleya sp. NBC_00888]